MNTKRYFFAALICFALLFAGCGSNQVIADLQLAVDALEIAVPLVGPSAGLPPVLLTQIENYLGATGTAIGKASDILAGSGTDGEKSAQIVAAFAGIAVPLVPSQYAGIAGAVQQVALLVAKFLASLPATGAASSKAVTSVSALDHQKLSGIKLRAAGAARAMGAR